MSQLPSLVRNLATWDGLYRFGRLNVLTPSAIALVVVPFVASLYLSATAVVRASASKFVEAPQALQFIERMIGALQLSTSLMLTYLSAWILIAAKILYNIRCPPMIKSYAHSEGTQFFLDHPDANARIADYVYRAYTQCPDRVTHLFALDCATHHTRESLGERFRGQTVGQLLPLARAAVQQLHPLSRYACLILYLLASGLLILVVLLQTRNVLTYLRS